MSWKVTVIDEDSGLALEDWIQEEEPTPETLEEQTSKYTKVILSVEEVDGDTT